MTRTTGCAVARIPTATTTGATSTRPRATGFCSTPARRGPATPTSAPPWRRAQPGAHRRQRRPEALVKLGETGRLPGRLHRGRHPARLPEHLFKYNAVVFFSTSRDALDDAAQTSLRQYVRGGGGFVGIHNAFGTEYNWPWYEGLLGGANFYDHGPDAVVAPCVGAEPQGRPPPRICRPAGTSPTSGTTSCPAPSKVRVLAEVDESTLAEGRHGQPRPPRPRQAPPGRLVPVLRRRTLPGSPPSATTPRHFPTDGSFPGADRVPEAGPGRHRVRHGHDPVLPGRLNRSTPDGPSDREDRRAGHRPHPLADPLVRHRGPSPTSAEC